MTPPFAFPASVDVAANQRGMTLEDWFAGLAMQALIQARAMDDDAVVDMQVVADDAYDYAAWMLAAREQALPRTDV